MVGVQLVQYVNSIQVHLLTFIFLKYILMPGHRREYHIIVMFFKNSETIVGPFHIQSHSYDLLK